MLTYSLYSFQFIRQFEGCQGHAPVERIVSYFRNGTVVGEANLSEGEKLVKAPTLDDFDTGGEKYALEQRAFLEGSGTEFSKATRQAYGSETRTVRESLVTYFQNVVGHVYRRKMTAAVEGKIRNLLKARTSSEINSQQGFATFERSFIEKIP